ncbi:MAG: PAS domain-containing protein [Candidatus Competibacterales bacterium]
MGRSHFYDPRLRPWYQRGRRAIRPLWSPVYQYSSDASVQLGIMATLALRDRRGHFAGVVGCDLSLHGLGQFLARLPLGPRSRVVIVDDAGLLVASSHRPVSFAVDGGLAQRLKAHQVDDPAVAAAIAHLTHHLGPLAARTEPAVLDFLHGGEIHFVDLAPLALANAPQWWLVLVVPEAEATRDLDTGTRQKLSRIYETLAALNDALERRVLDRTKALEASQAALHQSEERWQLALKGSGDGIWDWDIEGGSVFCSERWRVLFGYGEGEFDGTLAAFQRRIYPEDRARIEAQLADHLAGRTPTYSCEFRTRGRDGRSKWVHERGQALWNAQGRAVRLVGACSDIDARKQLEAELIHIKKLETIGQLTGRITHDFNNLLTVIHGNLALLKGALDRGGQGLDDATVGELVEDATGATLSGIALMRGLSTFARRQPLNPQHLDLGEFLPRFERTLRRLTPQNIALHTTVQRGLPPLYLDAALLENALLNLAINAHHAMPGGGNLRLNVDGVDVVDGEADLEPGRYVRLTVVDTGTGMDEVTAERALEPFFTTKGQGGTGLGLSSVHDFVKQSGGVLRLRSAPAQGTEVALYFPSTIGRGVPALEEPLARTV